MPVGGWWGGGGAVPRDEGGNVCPEEGVGLLSSGGAVQGRGAV